MPRGHGDTEGHRDIWIERLRVIQAKLHGDRVATGVVGGSIEAEGKRA